MLRARKDVLAGPFGDEIQDWRPVEGRKGPGKCRDDALDAVAGCLEAEPTPIRKTAPLARPRHDWRGTARTYRVVME